MHRHECQPTFQQNEKVAYCPKNELNGGGNFIIVDMRRQTETQVEGIMSSKLLRAYKTDNER